MFSRESATLIVDCIEGDAASAGAARGTCEDGALLGDDRRILARGTAGFLVVETAGAAAAADDRFTGTEFITLRTGAEPTTAAVVVDAAVFGRADRAP